MILAMIKENKLENKMFLLVFHKRACKMLTDRLMLKILSSTENL